MLLDTQKLHLARQVRVRRTFLRGITAAGEYVVWAVTSFLDNV